MFVQHAVALKKSELTKPTSRLVGAGTELGSKLAPGTVSRRLHNASTNPVDFGALEWSPEESMKTSKGVHISSLTRNTGVLASFETATE
jgi:hypothetical protein